MTSASSKLLTGESKVIRSGIDNHIDVRLAELLTALASPDGLPLPLTAATVAGLFRLVSSSLIGVVCPPFGAEKRGGVIGPLGRNLIGLVS